MSSPVLPKLNDRVRILGPKDDHLVGRIGKVERVRQPVAPDEELMWGVRVKGWVHLYCADQLQLVSNGEED